MRSDLYVQFQLFKADQDSDLEMRQQMDDFQRQIREMNSTTGQITDAQRQLRDLIHELDSKMGEVRGEALHLAELQSAEEQRLRRQGVELQGLFEAMRQQFNDEHGRLALDQTHQTNRPARDNVGDEQLLAIHDIFISLESRGRAQCRDPLC